MTKIIWGFAVAVLFLWGGSATAEEGFASAPEEIHPLLVGGELPRLALKTADDLTFDLNAENKTKPLVIVFYRGHW